MENLETENKGLNGLEQPTTEQQGNETSELDTPVVEVSAVETPEKSAEIPVIKEPEFAPMHVVKELRTDRAELREQLAKKDGIIETLQREKTTQVAVQQKSPMQIAAEDQGVDVTQPDWRKQVVVDGELEEQQYFWRENQKVLQSRVESTADAAQQHSDFKEICRQGEQHLTLLEVNELRKCTSNFGQKAYELCTKALLRAGIKTVPEVPKVIPTAQSATNKGSELPKKPIIPTQDEILSGISPAIQKIMTF
jgi:hypothetical protein